MDFKEVLKDVEKMIGQKLDSIRTGAEIVLIEVTDEKVLLTNKKNKTVSRSIPELKRIWTALAENPAIHVDSVLRNSGSSRNQPETILANLPYVEYLYIDNKKHLCLCEVPSHKIGTLKRATPEQALKVTAKYKEKKLPKEYSTIVIFSGDLATAAKEIANLTSRTPEAIESGIYQVRSKSLLFLLVSQSIVDNKIEPGTYVVAKGKIPQGGARKIKLLEKNYYAYTKGGLNILLEEPNSI